MQVGDALMPTPGEVLLWQLFKGVIIDDPSAAAGRQKALE